MKTDQIKALYRSDFSAFLRFAYGELHRNQPLADTWHIDVLADHLERVARGEITRLIINMPPRSLKSLAASIALPVWMHGRNPALKIMSIAGSRELAGDFERGRRELMTAPRFRSLYPHLKPEDRGRNLYLPHGGRQISAVVGGKLVGRGADLIVIDDPIGPAKVHDEPSRRAVNKWFDAEVIQRLNDKTKGAVIIVMQRLHHEDLSAHLLRDKRWVHLNLPAMATEDEVWKLSRGQILTREKRGALAPTIDDSEALFTLLLQLGAYNFAAQYQQKPYERMEDDACRGGMFGLPDDEYGFPAFSVRRVHEIFIMAYEIWGFGAFHPAMPMRRMSEEEWIRYGVWTTDYQRRLLENGDAKWGPPENEAALLAEYYAWPGTYVAE